MITSDSAFSVCMCSEGFVLWHQIYRTNGEAVIPVERLYNQWRGRTTNGEVVQPMERSYGLFLARTLRIAFDIEISPTCEDLESRESTNTRCIEASARLSCILGCRYQASLSLINPASLLNFAAFPRWFRRFLNRGSGSMLLLHDIWLGLIFAAWVGCGVVVPRAQPAVEAYLWQSANTWWGLIAV